MKVPVRIYTELAHEHGLPVYAHQGDSGMDIRANEAIHLQPKETKLIPTGVFVGLPEDYEIQVRPRSGMSLKTKFRICNSPGTVDSCFLGEICIIAENTHSTVGMHIAKGERIAQIVLQYVPRITWLPVDSKEKLGRTVRGFMKFNLHKYMSEARCAAEPSKEK